MRTREGDEPFDKHSFLWGHAPQILPAMLGIVLDTVGLSASFRGDARYGDEIVVFVDGAVVAEGERHVKGWMGQRPPEIDDLESMLEELGRLGGGEMEMDSGDGRRGGLVDVDLFDWLAFTWDAYTEKWGLRVVRWDLPRVST